MMEYQPPAALLTAVILMIFCSTAEADDVRLVNGSSRCDGTVEVFLFKKWTTVFAEFRSITEAALVCRQLDCGSVVAVTYKRLENKSSEWRPIITCEGVESALRECKIYRSNVADASAQVICSGLLVQPNISFSTPIRVSWGLQGPVVIRNHSFTITCSTQPQHPGGSFYLKLPWTNRSHTHTAVNHSASFFFPAADDSHQGNYSCVYENTVTFQAERFTVLNNQSNDWDSWSPGPFLHNFSSDSEPLFLTVTGQQGSAAAVQYENIELVTLQSSAEEQQNVERRSGEEQEEEEEQSRT